MDGRRPSSNGSGPEEESEPKRGASEETSPACRKRSQKKKKWRSGSLELLPSTRCASFAVSVEVDQSVRDEAEESTMDLCRKCSLPTKRTSPTPLQFKHQRRKRVMLETSRGVHGHFGSDQDPSARKGKSKEVYE